MEFISRSFMLFGSWYKLICDELSTSGEDAGGDSQ
jgi:hypothetical protein